MTLNRQIIFHLAMLLALLWVFESTGLDVRIQDHFYAWDQHRWIVDRHDPLLRLLFYTGIKRVIIVFGLLCLSGWLLSYRFHALMRLRRACMLMSLTLALVPLTVAGLKQVSNVYTPARIERYGGDKPYVKVLERYPSGFRQKSRAKGWPAGHASGGFSLMMLYCAAAGKRRRMAGLFLGIILGWTMGLYQMLKGAHFLSHTMVTMSVAWLWILVIVRFSPDPSIKRQRDDRTEKVPPGLREQFEFEPSNETSST